MKRKQIADLFQRIGGVNPELVGEVMPCPQPYGYRNRIMIRSQWNKPEQRLNIGFVRCAMPRSGQLLIHSGDLRVVVRPFDASDNNAANELWTPVVNGAELVAELLVRTADVPSVSLRLTHVGSGYRFFGAGDSALSTTPLGSGSCNVDVVCPLGNAWRNEIPAIAAYSTGGTVFCTGFMVNNTAQDARNYFMTAYHCGIRSSNAASLVVYWNYENTVCAGPDDGALTRFNTGAVLRAGYATSDFTLVELNAAPNPAHGVRYAGWNRGQSDATAAVGIHHPSGDPKKISFENHSTQTTSYSGTSSPGDGTHVRVVDWDTGTTEPGSSGSPLFDQDHLVVGQLHGGWAACGNNESDWYGWLQRSWDGGGSAETRLMDWLDPGATGAVTLPLLDPAAGSFAVTPTAAIEASGPQGGPFTVSDWEYTLTNDGEVAVNYTAAVDVDWLTVAPASGSIAIGGAATVTVSLASPSIGLDAGTHEAAVTFGNPNRGSSEPRTLRLEIIPDRSELAGVVPNPFRDYTSVRVALPAAGSLVWRVFDLRGRLVRGPVTLEGVLGENEIAWDGHDAGGRRLPTGAYVMAIQAPDREIRVPLACAR